MRDRGDPSSKAWICLPVNVGDLGDANRWNMAFVN